MPIVRHLWSFGDGDYSTDKDPSHLYRMPGIYTVIHTVWDERDDSSSTSGQISVYRWSRESGGLNVSRTNKCYCYGFNREQGIGPHERSGSAWVFPEANVGIVKIIDSISQPHTLVLDNSSGNFFDITTRKGPSNTSLEKIWTDNADTNGGNGTDVAPSVTFGEDMGTRERYFIEHKESHIYLRPISESNRDQSGYDSEGYPSGLEINLSIFKDGEQSDASSTVSDIPFDGDIHFDQKVEGHRLYLKASANKGDHFIVTREQNYAIRDRSAAPQKRKMSNDTYQQNFSSPKIWVGWFRGSVVNLKVGTVLSGVSATATTGPDSQESGISVSGAANFGSVSIGASGSVLLWVNETVVAGEIPTTIAMTIGGTSVTLLSHGTSSGWSLLYADSVGESGDLIITPTGTAEVFDIRGFDSAIDSTSREYYYADINDGGHVMARRI